MAFYEHVLASADSRRMTT